jgi:arylamine N-acetyltransferase
MKPDLVDKYLGILGVHREPPSIHGLKRLVHAHVCHVPFENISKLHYMKHHGIRSLLGLDLYLNGVEKYRFGGTCYPINYYFYRLLVSLGYQARLCGADMSNPDVHLVSMVDIDGHEYLVDVGYAAPFTEPLPRDSITDYTISLGSDRYVLKPKDTIGRSRLELYRGGQLKHSYVAKPTPRSIEEFETAITDSFRNSSTFMNTILLARFCPEKAVVIHNFTILEFRGFRKTKRIVEDAKALSEVINDIFGIPSEISTDVLNGLHQFGDAWT